MQDLATKQPWPKCRAAVLERALPFRSAVVYSLDVADTDLGALALYANKPGFFSDEFALDAGGVLADHAAIAFEAAVASDRAGHLALSLTSGRYRPRGRQFAESER